jgi:hypothetical protein
LTNHDHLTLTLITLNLRRILGNDESGKSREKTCDCSERKAHFVFDKLDWRKKKSSGNLAEIKERGVVDYQRASHSGFVRRKKTTGAHRTRG